MNRDSSSAAAENADTKKPRRGRPPKTSLTNPAEALQKHAGQNGQHSSHAASSSQPVSVDAKTKTLHGRAAALARDGDIGNGDSEVSSSVGAISRKRGRPTGTSAALTASTSQVSADDGEEDAGLMPPPARPKKRGRAVKATGVDSTSGPAESKKASGRNKTKTVVDDEDEEDIPAVQPVVTKQVVIKGRAPVDEAFADASNYHVFCEGDDVWDAALNQTNIGNNNNKFYLIQILEHDSRKNYCVFNRWGRVGFGGQNATKQCGPDVDQAKQEFKKKFRDKTKNHWEDRESFEKHPGQYDIVLRDYSATTDEPSGRDVPDAPKTEDEEDFKMPPSVLEERVQNLVQTIFNISLMEQQVSEMNYDANKAPLGRLTEAQVKAGYASLKRIEELITLGQVSSRDMVEACSEYYTKIPHIFGMKTPPLIQTPGQLKRELDLLETLCDIEIAMRVLKRDKVQAGPVVNPIDHHYGTLKTQIKPIDREGEIFKVVKRYLEEGRGPTHDFQVELADVFELEKDGDFKKDVGNRMLLWHGSRLSNFVGILSQGLRIAPPEAPVTGYMFGKGVYFADVSTKSANYCYANSSEGTGYMLLCDVALGKPVELFEAKYDADRLPHGFASTKGVGRHYPDQTTHVTWEDGLKVPLGRCVKAEDAKRGAGNYSLDYNEYIVYDTKQIRMRYLVQVKFNRGRLRR